jgi:hypothetical protein
MATMDLRELFFQMQAMASKVTLLENHVAKLEEREVDRAKQRKDDERKIWVTGVTTLGAIVMALFGVIWAYRMVIFGGKP